MLKSISFLEKFSVCSKIMPYYAPLHSSFSLLSQISWKSRAMLDEFYEEILNWMLNTANWILISEENEKAMFLPWDLFKFTIDLKQESTVIIFLQLLEEIKQNKGYYFNKHYMHTRFWIIALYVDPILIHKLYPSLELLKETEIIGDINIDDTSFSYQKTKLIDKFSLKIKQSFCSTENKIVFPHYVNKFEDRSQINPEFILFKRVFYLNLSDISIEESIELLEDIRDLELKIDYICISSKSSNELELITSPEYYK